MADDMRVEFLEASALTGRCRISHRDRDTEKICEIRQLGEN
jgi:hypothetical protein